MISLSFSDICEGCTRADLELDCFETESWNKDYFGKCWSVKCKHEEVCQLWSHRYKSAQQQLDLINDEKASLYEKIANLELCISNTEVENG